MDMIWTCLWIWIAAPTWVHIYHIPILLLFGVLNDLRVAFTMTLHL